MSYYALVYEVADDFVPRRGLYRAEHFRLVPEANRRGELLPAGAIPGGGCAMPRDRNPVRKSVAQDRERLLR